MTSSNIDFSAARAILRENDRGAHTVPTRGLYPFQWSWDSAITALGWLQFDEPRAWAEAKTMFAGQWDDGMLPHILFHGDADSYFPGPDVWGDSVEFPSSAHTQPPVWATTLKMMYEAAADRELAADSINGLLPSLVAYQRWFYRARDPDGTGLVCSYHPWESGMDNSPAWDAPLGAVPPVDWEYLRRDLGHVDAEQRPHKPEYDRYLYLVDFFKSRNYDSLALFRECPYKVIDIGMVSILQRAGLDLLALCDQFGYSEGVDEIRTSLSRTQAAIDRLWDPKQHCYTSYDLRSETPLDVVTTATVLPLLGGLVSGSKSKQLLDMLSNWVDATSFALSSTHPASEAFEPQRYWRGPVWIHINWLIATGALDYGRSDIAERLRNDAKRCIAAAGYHEYFDCSSGAGCGGDNFSWTAAVTLFWLDDSVQLKK